MLLAPRGVERHDATVQHQGLEQFRDGRNLVGPGVHSVLAQVQALTKCRGAVSQSWSCEPRAILPSTATTCRPSAEASFRTLLQSLFLQMAEPTQSEKSSQGERSDHEITVGGHLYIIEAKYNRPAAAGLAQIRERSYGWEHLDAGLVATAMGPCIPTRQGQEDLAGVRVRGFAHLAGERKTASGDAALDPEREYKPPFFGG